MRLRALLVALLLALAAPVAADIQYVGGQVGAFAGTNSATTITFTSLTGGLAAAPAAGDLVVITYSVGGTSDVSLYIRNTGAVDYTLIGSELYQNGSSYDSNLRVAYRFMPSPTETQAVLSPTGGTQNAAAWVVMAFRGVDTSSPLDVAAVTGGNTGTMHPDPAQIGTSTALAWIIGAGGGALATGGNYTAAYWTVFRTTTSSDTVDADVGMGYIVQSEPGNYDPAAWTGGGTDGVGMSWNAVTFALRPYNPPACTAGLNLTLLGVGGCP